MIEAALDTSFGISLAVTEDGQLIFKADAPFEHRASDATLVPWVEERFLAADLALPNVTRWTVGIGPGSFTGLRCGIAFVKGICLQTAAICRGLPSSLAVASQLLQDNKTVGEIAVLNDARRGMVILSHFKVNGNGILELLSEPVVLEPQKISPEIVEKAIFGSIHQSQIAEFLPPEVLAKITFFEQIDASFLVAPAGWEWPDYDALPASLEPIYVRPAVFVEPKPVPRAII